MHVTVSRSFPDAIRSDIEAVVRAGFVDVDSHDVEVHVKARARVRRVYVIRYDDGSRVSYRRKREAAAVATRRGGVVESQTYRHPRAGGWSGRTYDGIPRIARVESAARYLVTMNIPTDPRRLTRYPCTHQDPRLKTSPVVVFDSWHDELFHLAAHEARHVHQFRHGLSRSELDAERWAASVLAAHPFELADGSLSGLGTT